MELSLFSLFSSIRNFSVEKKLSHDAEDLEPPAVSTDVQGSLKSTEEPAEIKVWLVRRQVSEEAVISQRRERNVKFSFWLW